jgi:hypothetical protein
VEQQHRADVQNQLRYQTYTDFSQVPSGQGVMDRSAFRPNGNPTQLNGDWDAMWFFYDLDQTIPAVQDAIFDWTAWLWDEVGIRGYRLDAVKHYPDWFNGLMMNRMRAAGKVPEVVVGEFFDGNSFTLKNWVDQATAAMDDETRAAVRIRAFDFGLREALKQACDAFGYDARNVFESGMVDAAGSSGFDAITFVNNHDFRYPGQEVINNPELAYAYILTNNRVGLPCVFYPDYYLGGAMRYQIQGLMEVQRRYIAGSPITEYLNEFGSFYSGNYLSGFPNTTLIYQLSGGPSGRSAVVVINFAGETLRLDHSLNTGFVPIGDTLTDIFSVSPNPFAIVNGSSQAYFEVPARSFGVWVQGDLREELISIEEPVSGQGLPGLIPDFAWSLAPNPASDQLLLSWNPEALPPMEQSGPLQLRIFGTDGRAMLEERVERSAGAARLPLDPRWSEGIYWLEFSAGASRSTRIFAIQR